MLGRLGSFFGFGAPQGDKPDDLETRLAQAERIQALQLSDSVKKRRIDELMRTPGVGTGTMGSMAIPRRELQLGSADLAPPKSVMKEAAKGRGPALAWTPMLGSWNTEKSAIDWVVKHQPTAYLQKYRRQNYIVFTCSGHVDCQAQIKITMVAVEGRSKVALPAFMLLNLILYI